MIELRETESKGIRFDLLTLGLILIGILIMISSVLVWVDAEMCCSCFEDRAVSGWRIGDACVGQLVQCKTDECLHNPFVDVHLFDQEHWIHIMFSGQSSLIAGLILFCAAIAYMATSNRFVLGGILIISILSLFMALSSAITVVMNGHGVGAGLHLFLVASSEATAISTYVLMQSKDIANRVASRKSSLQPLSGV